MRQYFENLTLMSLSKKHSTFLKCKCPTLQCWIKLFLIEYPVYQISVIHKIENISRCDDDGHKHVLSVLLNLTFSSTDKMKFDIIYSRAFAGLDGLGNWTLVSSL